MPGSAEPKGAGASTVALYAFSSAVMLTAESDPEGIWPLDSETGASLRVWFAGLFTVVLFAVTDIFQPQPPPPPPEDGGCGSSTGGSLGEATTKLRLLLVALFLLLELSVAMA